MRRQLDALSLPAAQVAWIESALVPALYVQHRIALGRNADERAWLPALWTRLRGQVLCEASPWRTWDAETQRVVQRVVQSCVAMFPRSTSASRVTTGRTPSFITNLTSSRRRFERRDSSCVTTW